MNDISLGQIENDKNYDFRSKYDEENELYTNNIEKCRYYEVSELKGAFVKHNQGFSIYSHNIRSINGHWDDILDNINTTQPLKFSILAFQEIWSVQRTYEIPGYNKLEYFTRDKDGAPNPNCGGGVGIFVDKKYDYEILNVESAFVPHVYESIWVKVKVKSGPDKIIGNVYRPNSAPKADLMKALEIHDKILDVLQNDRKHAKCEIIICSDFNINMLNFETHNLTNDYINSLISKSFIPVITLPTRIKHQSATLIDHIWRNKITNNFKSGILISSLSDHFPVFYFEESKQKNENPQEIYKRKVNNTTIETFCNTIKSTSWVNVTNENSPKISFDKFFEKINSSVDLSFPFIKIKSKPKKFKHSPWMSSGLFISHRKKEKLFAKKISAPLTIISKPSKFITPYIIKSEEQLKKCTMQNNFQNFLTISKKHGL